MKMGKDAAKPMPSRIISMASLFYDSCVLFAAIELGVFEKLAKIKSCTASELARELKVDENRLALLLNACVAEGLLEKEADKYKNSEESDMFLVPGKPSDLSSAIKYNKDVYPLWGRLVDLVRTGKPVEKPAIHLGDDKKRTRTFVMAMHGRAMAIGNMVVPFIELSGCKKVIDAGCGSGAFSILLSRKYPDIHFIAIDLPPVISITRELITMENLNERIETIAGNYHDVLFPDNCDAVLFLGVLHQESSSHIQLLLKKAYNSLSTNGRIYIMDMMTDATRTKPKFSALFALNMALTTESGWVFSDHEINTWLAEAGFARIIIKPLPEPLPHWLASAVKL